MGNTLVGKYILEDWECNGHKSRHLRWINRETKKYYCSDVQRTVRNWNLKTYIYEFHKKWATNFVKDDSELGFRRSITHLSNTDGVMKYSVLQSPADCKCEYTFDEVFGNDLRDIQDPNDSPLCEKLFKDENIPELKGKQSYKQFLILNNPNSTNHSSYKNEFIKKLQRLFNVSDVYDTSFEKISEHEKQTIMTKSATLFQIIDSNYDKKKLTMKENTDNLTILFWLFDDRLVYQREDGKNTW